MVSESCGAGVEIGIKIAPGNRGVTNTDGNVFLTLKTHIFKPKSKAYSRRSLGFWFLSGCTVINTQGFLDAFTILLAVHTNHH